MESLMRGNKLYSACINGDINSLNRLLKEDRFVLEDYGSSVGFCLNGTPLHVAATRGHVEFAELLLHHKPQLVGERDSRSRTPLHLAVANGSLEMVRLLLERTRLEDNDIPLMTDECGRTPLHLASANGKVEIIKLLLEKAGNSACLLMDEFGRTPLRLAVMKNAGPQVVKALAISEPEAIADLLSSTKTVRILHSYVLRKGVEALDIFARVGTPASAYSFLCSQDEEGNTILHKIISLRRKEMLGSLISDNQNDRYLVAINLTNRNNLTVLDLIDQMPKDPTIKSIRNHIAMHSTVDTGIKNWVDENKESIMVVATLIAAMAYQAGLSPPGGVWDEDDKTVYSRYYNRSVNSTAGTSIMSSREPVIYSIFRGFNSAAFVGSTGIMILILVPLLNGNWISKRFHRRLLTLLLWVSVPCMIGAYASAVIGVRGSQMSSKNIILVVSYIGIVVFSLMLGVSFMGIVHLNRQISSRNVTENEHPQGNDNI